MIDKKKLMTIYRRLDRAQRIEFIAAAVVTVALIVSVPVYAWFSYTDRLATLTRVNTPPSLDLRAGNADEIRNFELKDIDIEKIATDNQPKCYVFGVKNGDPNARYDIQIAHTTNIPFTYTLYRATEGTSSNFDVDYTPRDDDQQHTYYLKDGAALNLQVLNSDSGSAATYGRTLASTSDGYYSKTYNDSTAPLDAPEIYAVPLYSQVRGIQAGGTEYDYFILELDWDRSATHPEGYEAWNKAENNKETDVIYISAKAS